MSDYEKRLDAAKRGSTLQLLFRCSRILNERALTTYPENSSLREVRPAHMALFPHIDLHAGTRITELATRLGITKQAVGQLVDDLEVLGVVRRERDRDDQRAKRVVFTSDGKLSMLDGLAHLKSIEKQLSRRVGAPVMKSLREALVALHAHLESNAS